MCTGGGWSRGEGGKFFVPMTHEIAKILLQQASTFLQRTEAIEVALSLGMPLHEIEQYLDHLDAGRLPLDDAPLDVQQPDDETAWGGNESA
jgi:hypothetical protein